MLAEFTWGHLLTIVAAFVLLYAFGQAITWRRHAGHGRGTPGYARARDGRRYAAWSLLVALLLFALGWLTPLAGTAIAGGAA
ncbi:hypothetical protein E2493_12300 [Sphingomonas parva]|uniref:Uncharacterized protein n=1 Tax=Sphingomonas parva TaxID=2555898 RepID=A0A4Y8ZPM8_9SPHN|nr:hypothetical protein [Sphingomonas parva]TFI57970.1 hypothetical protein E2493_12300 [Sphingomonas parva]